MNKHRYVITMVAALLALGLSFAAFNIHPVSAQFSKDNGTSGLTLKEESQIPGWDPNRTEGIDEQRCIGCANVSSPSQAAQDAGTIGQTEPDN